MTNGGGEESSQVGTASRVWQNGTFFLKVAKVRQRATRHSMNLGRGEHTLIQVRTMR